MKKYLPVSSKQFWCIADESKRVDLLGEFPIAVEVIPSARSMVARNILKIRWLIQSIVHGFTSDYGNPILDVYGLDLSEPVKLEKTLNNLTGVGPVMEFFCCVTLRTRLFLCNSKGNR